MKKSSHTNHLTFYAIAITSVVVLFKIVSTYGENNLKAAPLISGDYNIKSDNLPACLQQENLRLHIEQSGVFLFAKLANTHLDGRIENNQISLSGHPSALSDCTFADAHLTIEGNVKDDLLTGAISWDATTPKSSFTAKREVVQSSEAGH
jgi:hypothetical protein